MVWLTWFSRFQRLPGFARDIAPARPPIYIGADSTRAEMEKLVT
ncbi:MAG: hypothetical protein V3R90_16795 [Limibaculum sp.]